MNLEYGGRSEGFERLFGLGFLARVMRLRSRGDASWEAVICGFVIYERASQRVSIQAEMGIGEWVIGGMGWWLGVFRFRTRAAQQFCRASDGWFGNRVLEVGRVDERTGA